MSFGESNNKTLPIITKPPKKQQILLNSSENKNTPSKDYEGFRIAGLAFSILGVFLCPVTILGIVFSTISLYRINQNPRLKGKGLALADLIIGITMLAIITGAMPVSVALIL